MTRPAPTPLQVVAALLIVYVVWGSTYLAIAVMIETLPPLLAAGARFAIAGLFVLGFLLVRSPWRSVDRPRAVHWRATAIVGTLLLLGGNGGVVLAEQYIPTGVAAVLVATVPIWIAVFDAILSRRRPSLLVIGGLVAGIVGVAVLLVPLEGLDRLDPLGVALVVGAALSWACGSLYARNAPLPASPLVSTGMEMLTGGLVVLSVGLLTGELSRADPAAFSIRSLAAFAYLIVFGSIVAYTAYTWLLANVAVSTVATYAYVNPVVAVALGALFYAEPLSPRTAVASVVIIAAVVAMVSGRPRPAEAPAPEPRVSPAATHRRLRGTEPAAGDDA